MGIRWVLARLVQVVWGVGSCIACVRAIKYPEAAEAAIMPWVKARREREERDLFVVI